MILKRIFIKNFGGLQDKTIEFSSGVNMFYGVNEAEKKYCVYFYERYVLWDAGRRCEKE